ncbi:MAG: PD40 domain-containing protein, partial [Anaerolineales bacterium]|nr:PD40 domain-containing protein [Anaerolineales bacterium]
PLPGDTRTLSFSADNSLVAAGISNTVTIWRTDTGQKLIDLVQPGEVWAGALSPDGRRLAASLTAGEIVLWDLAGRPISQTLPTGLGCLFSVEFSPDGAYLAAGGSRDGRTSYCTGAQIDVWDLTAGQERTPQPVVIRPTSVIFPNAVIATSFSPDGQRLAVAGNQGAAILDWATGPLAFTMTAHTASLNYLKYSPDGKYLVTTSNDQTAKIWDAQTGTELLSYPLSSRSVWAFFTPQARGVVIVTSGVRTFRLNAFGLDELITAARARLVRDWEPEECQKYLHGPCP